MCPVVVCMYMHNCADYSFKEYHSVHVVKEGCSIIMLYRLLFTDPFNTS